MEVDQDDLISSLDGLSIDEGMNLYYVSTV